MHEPTKTCGCIGAIVAVQMSESLQDPVGRRRNPKGRPNQGGRHAEADQPTVHRVASGPLTQPGGQSLGGVALAAHLPGQVGVRPDGTIEQGFPAQAERAWDNVLSILATAGIGPANLVKVNIYLTRAGDVVNSRRIREAKLTGAAPASTLAVVAALASPRCDCRGRCGRRQGLSKGAGL